MQHLIVGLALFLTAMCFSQTTTTASITGGKSVTATVTNATSDQGVVYFALYDSTEKFRSKESIASQVATVKGGRASVKFKNLKPGIYAIVCYHDANDNQRLDFDTSGIPTEDYGATNNIKNFGPPQFEQAKFEVKDKDDSFEIIF